MKSAIRKLVYRLKRNFSREIFIYHTTGTDTYNLETGIIQLRFTATHVRHAAVIPGDQTRKYVYDLSYVAANKNFVYGGLFDTTTRTVIIDAKDYTTDIAQEDRIVYDGKLWEIKQFTELEDKQGWILVISHLTNADPYHETLRSMINAGFEATDYTLVALDMLIREITYGVFAGSVPDSLLVWPCCGKTLTDALMCIWHPTAIGTSLTNSGFITTDYTELGPDAGLQGDGTNYLSTGWNPSDQVTGISSHITIYGAAMLEADTCLIGARSNASDYWFELEFPSLSSLVGRNGDQYVEFDTVYDDGCLSVSVESISSLKVLVNGAWVATTTTTSSTNIPDLPLFILASNNSGVAERQSSAKLFGTVLCSKLTETQIATLYTAMSQFQTRLGRL